MSKKHNHYFKECPYEEVDVYRVLALFNVTDPCIQHAVKKLLVAGGRGAGKDIHKDISEAIDTLVRWQEMREEEEYVEDDPLGQDSLFKSCKDLLKSAGETLNKLMSFKGGQDRGPFVAGAPCNAPKEEYDIPAFLRKHATEFPAGANIDEAAGKPTDYIVPPTEDNSDQLVLSVGGDGTDSVRLSNKSTNITLTAHQCKLMAEKFGPEWWYDKSCRAMVLAASTGGVGKAGKAGYVEPKEAP